MQKPSGILEGNVEKSRFETDKYIHFYYVVVIYLDVFEACVLPEDYTTSLSENGKIFFSNFVYRTQCHILYTNRGQHL